VAEVGKFTDLMKFALCDKRKMAFLAAAFSATY